MKCSLRPGISLSAWASVYCLLSNGHKLMKQIDNIWTLNVGDEVHGLIVISAGGVCVGVLILRKQTRTKHSFITTIRYSLEPINSPWKSLSALRVTFKLSAWLHAIQMGCFFFSFFSPTAAFPVSVEPPLKKKKKGPDLPRKERLHK